MKTFLFCFLLLFCSIFFSVYLTAEDGNTALQNNGEHTSAGLSDAVIDRAVKTVLPLKFQNQEKKVLYQTLSFIHPSGLCLAVPHHLPYQKIPSGLPFNHLACRVIARIPQCEMAIVKICPVPVQPLPDIRFETSENLGRKSLLFTVINLHNSGLYVRRGLFDVRQPMKLEITELDNVLVPDMLVDSEGASGAAVFNQCGNVIGIVTGWFTGRLPLAIVIPTETFLPECKKNANITALFGLKLDLETGGINGQDGLFIVSVNESSNLKQMNIKPGDRIVKLGEWNIKDENDFWLSQLAWGLEKYNSPVPLTFVRGQNDQPFTLELPWTEEKLYGEKIQTDNLKSGCLIKVVSKDADRTVFEGRTESLTSTGISSNTKSEFTGCIKIPREGTYAFQLGVPGTGTLKIGSLEIKKDKNHPKMRVAGRGFFAAGLYRFSLLLDIDAAVSEPFLLVEMPLDSFESNNPSPLPDDWLFTKN